MIKLDALIVVEGKTDVSFLSSFIDSNFYFIHGLGLSRNDINFIKIIVKYKEVILLLDPDNIGNKIRSKIIKECPIVSNAYILKKESIKNNKVGVAESNKEAIIKALENRTIVNGYNKKIVSEYTLNDLFVLGLYGKDNSKVLRNKILKNYNLTYLSKLNFLFLINTIGLKKEKIECLI